MRVVDVSPSCAWQRELCARFGDAAHSLEEAIRAADKLLPLVAASHTPAHPLPYFVVSVESA